MVQWVIVLVIAVVVFVLFFLAFLLKPRPKGGPVEVKTCARCTCQKSADPPAARTNCRQH
jgi:hypothetical protein